MDLDPLPFDRPLKTAATTILELISQSLRAILNGHQT